MAKSKTNMAKKWQYQVFAFERVNGSKRPPVHLQQSHHSVRCRIAHELEYEGINEYVWQCSKTTTPNMCLLIEIGDVPRFIFSDRKEAEIRALTGHGLTQGNELCYACHTPVELRRITRSQATTLGDRGQRKMELTKCKLPALKDKAKGHGVGVSKKSKSQLIEAILTAEFRTVEK